MKLISSFLPYPTFSFIVVLLLASSEGQNTCSNSCGLQVISYPFRLKGDPNNCGDPNYELGCVGNMTATLELYHHIYHVTEISYENSWVRVVDPSLTSGNCTLPFNFPVDYSYGINNYILNGFFTSFLNCSKEIQEKEYHPVGCLSGNDSFVYFTSNIGIDGLLPSCSLLAIAPTSSTVEYNESSINSGHSIFEQLKKGFILQFDVFSTICPARDPLYQCLVDSSQNWSSFFQEFLACVGICKSEKRISDLTYHYTSVCIVFLQIVILMLETHTLVRFVVAPLPIYVFLAYKYWKSMVPMDQVEKFLQNQQTLTPTRYAYTDLIAMTRHFREKLGQGGFGSVYKGELLCGNLVAIKMLSNSNGNGEEFINEVSTIGRIRHHNVVRLVGFCSEGSHRALVYEFMPNGSLDKYIFSSNGVQRFFTPEKLNEIALAVAKGIDYLHRGCDMSILHFDIKPHNILLDLNFIPKVSDFGLAKLYPKDRSLVSLSATRGTVGYIAPELISRSFGAISLKSDVYSFGMLLMEMAGGRRNLNHKAENSSQVYYPSWIYDRLIQCEESEICINFEIDDMERKLCKVGLWCIQMMPRDRPSMSRVIEMLETDVDELEMPPKPFISTSTPVIINQSYMDSSSSELSVVVEHE